MRLPIISTIVFTLTISNTGWSGGAEDIGVAVRGGSLQPIAALKTDSYDDLLGRYVDEFGNVNYQAWLESSVDRRSLRRFLQAHSVIDAQRGNQNERLAFWINAYNALTIEGILREYPTSSIRNHTAKIFGYNIWDDLRLFVAGKAHSLNEIEHKILRKMNEPRIHFAIVCASKACPKLRNDAYRADQIDDQLSSNAKHFFSQAENFTIHGRDVRVSSILDWFGDDFGNNPEQVLRRISVWLPKSATVPSDPRIQYFDYDWSLNSQ